MRIANGTLMKPRQLRTSLFNIDVVGWGFMSFCIKYIIHYFVVGGQGISLQKQGMYWVNTEQLTLFTYQTGVFFCSLAWSDSSYGCLKLYELMFIKYSSWYGYSQPCRTGDVRVIVISLAVSLVCLHSHLFSPTYVLYLVGILSFLNFLTLDSLILRSACSNLKFNNQIIWQWKKNHQQQRKQSPTLLLTPPHRPIFVFFTSMMASTHKI